MEKPWYLRLFTSTPATSDAGSATVRAEAGDAAAQFFLGLRHSSGEESTRDLPAALRWYRLAADQNHHLAQFNLGVMLEQGQGTDKDSSTGQKWIRRAADAGDAGAQFNCGNRCYREIMMNRDTHTAVDRIQAYVWFELATLQGYRGAEASRNRVTVVMNHAEVAEAVKQVARFVPVVSACGAVTSPA